MARNEGGGGTVRKTYTTLCNKEDAGLDSRRHTKDEDIVGVEHVAANLGALGEDFLQGDNGRRAVSGASNDVAVGNNKRGKRNRPLFTMSILPLASDTTERTATAGEK